MIDGGLEGKARLLDANLYLTDAAPIYKRLNKLRADPIEQRALPTIIEFFNNRRNASGDVYYSPEEINRKLEGRMIVHDDSAELVRAGGFAKNSHVAGFNRNGEVHIAKESNMKAVIHEYFHSLGGFGDYFTDYTSWKGINESATELLASEAEGFHINGWTSGYSVSTACLSKIQQQLGRVTGGNLILEGYVNRDYTVIKRTMDNIWQEYSGYDGSSIFDRINQEMCQYNELNGPKTMATIQLRRDTELFERAVDEFNRRY